MDIVRTQIHIHTHAHWVAWAWVDSYWEEPCLQFTPGANWGHIVLKKVSDYINHPKVHMTPGECPQQPLVYPIVYLILAFSWQNEPGQSQDTMTLHFPNNWLLLTEE